MGHGNFHKFLLYIVCLILNVCNIKIFTMVIYIYITLRNGLGNFHKFLLYSICLILNVCNIKIFTKVIYSYYPQT